MVVIDTHGNGGCYALYLILYSNSFFTVYLNFQTHQWGYTGYTNQIIHFFTGFSINHPAIGVTITWVTPVMDLNPVSGSGPWGAPHLGVGRILNPGSLEAATEATGPPPASGDLKHITDDPKHPGDTYQTYQREREIYIYIYMYI